MLIDFTLLHLVLHTAIFFFILFYFLKYFHLVLTICICINKPAQLGFLPLLLVISNSNCYNVNRSWKIHRLHHNTERNIHFYL